MNNEFNWWLMREAFVDGQLRLADFSSARNDVTWVMIHHCGWELSYPKQRTQ